MPAAASRDMPRQLHALRTPYGLVMHAGDDHHPSRNRAERDRQALAWSASQGRTSAPTRAR